MKIVLDSKITVGEIILPFPEGFDSTELRQAFATVYETNLEDVIYKFSQNLDEQIKFEKQTQLVSFNLRR